MDMLYVQPQQPQSLKAIPTYVYYPLMVFTVLFSVVSLFFLPIDIAAIKMSLDPGFTVFFILVIVIFVIKLINIVWFYMVMMDATLIGFNFIHFTVLILGTLFVGGSLVVVFVEIYLLTNSILAALMHPFVIDFLLFMICNILAHVANCIAYKPALSYEYMPVPQRRMVYPMEAPVEMKEMPVPGAQVPIQYPDLSVQIAQEPIVYPEMPFQFVQTPPKKAEAPKVQEHSRVFVPYYIPK